LTLTEWRSNYRF